MALLSVRSLASILTLALFSFDCSREMRTTKAITLEGGPPTTQRFAVMLGMHVCKTTSVNNHCRVIVRIPVANATNIASEPFATTTNTTTLTIASWNC